MKDPIKNIKSELFFIDGVAEVGNHEGYRYDSEKRMAMFGTRVGPVHSISEGLLHEIAHTAEIKDLRRLQVLNFGLHISTQVEVLGQLYSEPITWNSTKLEARVILWQEVLCQIFKLPFDVKKFATALEYMPDFMCIPVKGYKFDSDLSTYVDLSGNKIENYALTNTLRLHSIYDYMDEQKATGKYAYSEFRKRWDSVMEFLETN